MGDRLRQSVNGSPTTYVLDPAAGLTQVLSDGTNTYLYGTSRLAEKQTGGWRYYAPDALGSVRQLVDNTGAVTLAKGYRPFGDPLTTAGTGVTMYGFTGEQRDSYIKLIFLRSRFYSPQTGTFITRDSWQGDYNRPLSLNRWNYALGNPVKYTDPSGHIPYHCQSMNTKAGYESCVLNYYGLEPFDPANMGQTIDGSPGCYKGPTRYRAPGYIEGIGGLFQTLLAGGVEVVYDFATMQQADFRYLGGGYHDTSVGISLSQYIGIVKGFKNYPSSIIEDYGGEFSSFTLGANDGIFNAGIGGGYFQSRKDPLITGGILYVGAGLNYSVVSFFDFAKLVSNYSLHSGYIKNYGDPLTGIVDAGRLFNDIQTGEGSPWLFNIIPLSSQTSRSLAAAIAGKYVRAYQEIHGRRFFGW